MYKKFANSQSGKIIIHETKMIRVVELILKASCVLAWLLRNAYCLLTYWATINTVKEIQAIARTHPHQIESRKEAKRH